MQSPTEILFENLRQYKKKYYLNKLLKGVIIFLAILLAAYILFNTLEFYGNFNTWFRGVFFFSFIAIILIVGGLWIGEPIYRLINNHKQLSDEEAARQIGSLLPAVKDKLLNTLQLSRLSKDDNELVKAGIAQRTNELSVFRFSETIHLEENKKYLSYLLPPLAAIILLLIFIPRLFTEGTKRIVKYNQEFLPEAPFRFILENNTLEIFKNEDLEIKLRLDGNSIPEAAYIEINGRKHKMEPFSDGTYTFTFKKIDKALDFRFEAAGFTSSKYMVDLKTRPVLNFFDVKLDFPRYLNKKAERLSNVGNLLIPEGTTIAWMFDTEDCDKLSLTLGNNGIPIEAGNFMGRGFEVKKQIFKSSVYSVQMANKFGMGKEKLEYSISVIPDEYPKISIEQFKDTTLFNYLVLGGNISDDYGLTDLKLFYRKNSIQAFSFSSDFVEQPTKTELKSISIKIAQNQNNQSYYYRWDIDSLQLKPGESLEYYLTVWDNDGVNGRKSTQSKAFELKLPSVREMEKSIQESETQAEKQITSSLDKAEELKKEVKKLEQKLKGKRQFDWQDKKAIEELLKKQESLQQELQELQEKHKEFTEKKDRFDKSNERIAEKTKLLQQLMNEMLDEETKKLYQELAKLLQEKNKENEVKDILEKLKNKDQNIEKDLDRALEMFKQLKFEGKLDDITDKLEQLAQKQEQLSEKSLEKEKTETGDKNDKTGTKDKDKNKKDDENKNTDNNKPENTADQLKEEQEKLNEEFKDVKKDIDELEKMNDELENKKELENTENQEEQIAQEQEKSSDALDKKNKKKAGQSQKKAADQMQQLSQKMKKMQESMESQEMGENMEDLRAILENLITLSYDQEDVMKEFKKVSQSDPRYVQLSQKQIKLKDDSKIIEDSLHTLAKRVFQIQSFITKELESMNNYMDESTVAIKARRADMAAGKQQFAMTSMNNLALLLSDVLKQMQEQMNDQKQGGKEGMKMKNKKKNKGNAPSLGQMQKNLNKQIEELKKSGMSGKQLSEELAKLAHQQERIRKSMNEMEGGSQGDKDGKNGNKPGGGDMEQLKREMEKTEADLVNKQITQQTLNRQQEILNRLLEHENAQRERELDSQREAQSAKDKNKKIPPTFEQYLRDKEKQVELLKTIPPNLNPYYKKEANEYFQKINSGGKE